MYPLSENISPPEATQFQSADFPTPMAISALKGIEILSSDKIKNLLLCQTKNFIESSERTILDNTSKPICDLSNFTLKLDDSNFLDGKNVTISNCSHFTLSNLSKLISLNNDSKFSIKIENCNNFKIEGITSSKGKNIVLISNSSTFIIKSCNLLNSHGSGIAIFNGSNFSIEDCRFSNNLSACILIVGNSYKGHIQNCICSHSHGYLNHDAAIHLCNTSERILTAHIPESCHEALSISVKSKRPHHILINGCTLSHCRAQGIYLEGAVNCVIEDNIIIGNNKEGICFDWGSCYNIFYRNIVSLNGGRKKISIEEIKADFIAEYPLLQDGSSSMKLPGISLDNGCLNLILNNRIINNYGGGIKMIRTALFNTFSKNEILYNAIGANTYVPYFHGVTALGLGAINEEFKNNKSQLLDFLPSINNTIINNTITEHWQPIFMDKASSSNTISGNITLPNKQIHTKLRTTLSRAKGFIQRFSANHLKKQTKQPS